jgi:hypothetical protein
LNPKGKLSEISIYTNGSKDQNRVAAAAVIKNDIFSACLPNESTMFTAEAKAIQLAFGYIKTVYDIFRLPILFSISQKHEH